MTNGILLRGTDAARKFAKAKANTENFIKKGRDAKLEKKRSASAYLKDGLYFCNIQTAEVKSCHDSREKPLKAK